MWRCGTTPPMSTAQPQPGAGGLPAGVGGRAMCLLSGGIDSPVAAYMMAKRGVEIECVHFFSYPYTSQLAKDKVLELARLVTRYSGQDDRQRGALHRDSGGHPATTAPRSYFTLIMRRFMMRHRPAPWPGEDGCGALVTGENLGQVASSDHGGHDCHRRGGGSCPFSCPLVGMDKEEIVTHRPEHRHAWRPPSSPMRTAAPSLPPSIPRPSPPWARLLNAERNLDRRGADRPGAGRA